MKTINVSEATGPALDWLVAKALGELEAEVLVGKATTKAVTVDDAGGPFSFRIGAYFKPSTNWSQGGPIIERDGINLSVDYQDDALSADMVQIGWKGNLWNNSVPGTSGFLQWAYGPTPLIAAMRCLVASKLGEAVEIPEELA